MECRQTTTSFTGMTNSVSQKQSSHEEGHQKTPDRRYDVKHLFRICAAAIFIFAVGFVIIFVPLQYFTLLPSTSHHSEHKSNSSGNVSQASWTKDKPYDEETKSYYRFMMDNVMKAMNRSVNPCDDFYEYACGRWGNHNQPAHGALRWTNFESMTFELWKGMTVKLKTLANYSSSTQDSKNTHTLQHNNSQLHDAQSSIQVLMSDYYKSCENEELLAQSGMDPLKDVLNDMDQLYLEVSEKLKPQQIFQRMLEYVHHNLSHYVLFSWKVETDTTLINTMTIELDDPNIRMIQEGMDSKDQDKLLDVYGQYANALLKMTGTFNNNNLDEEVHMILELLKIFVPLKGTYIANRPTISDLNKIAPVLDWQQYFNSALNRVGMYITKDEVVLSQVDDYLSILSEHLLSEISTWGVKRLYVYLRWEVAHYYSQFLHKPARSTVLPLIQEITKVNVSAIPNFRLRPCVKDVVKSLPLATNHLLVEMIKEILPETTTINDNIKTITKMAKIIKTEYLNYIKSFTWLEGSTKQIILDKLINADIKIGYPSIANNPFDLQEFYKELKLTDNHFTNHLAVLKFNQDNEMRLLRHPHMYSEWQAISPMSVASFYMYRRNVLLIPLGGLMHPVYSSNLPVYMAYATIGSLISHELGHAVDIIGRTRDKHGRVNDTIWDEATLDEFLNRVDCRANQYSNMYQPIENLLTISEVMADDGSVGTAFTGASHHSQDVDLPPTIMDSLSTQDLTPQQFFFLYYAQMFCSSSKVQNGFLNSMKHYPTNRARVTSTLANTPQFHEVFQCHKGTTMNPDVENCQIW